MQNYNNIYISSSCGPEVINHFFFDQNNSFINLGLELGFSPTLENIDSIVEKAIFNDVPLLAHNYF